jgi:hypothetical protein
MSGFSGSVLRKSLTVALAVLALSGAAVAPAQVTSVDPNRAIDGDLSAPKPATPAPTTSAPQPIVIDPEPVAEADSGTVTSPSAPATAEEAATAAAAEGSTFKQSDVLSAAEGVFGEGAAGLAGIIEDLLKKQGEPNAYIAGREGGGALVFGVRYGSGTLYHKIEGEMPVYWTGPSVGFDVGANAAKTFVLVYNLYDTADLYKRFPAGEGNAYVVGGFTASYLRKGDVVLIPIRVGVGVRLGVNAGYMKFSRKQKWLPF